MFDPNIKPDFTVDQENGSRWAVFNSPEHIEGFTILTSSGRELLQQHPESLTGIRDLICRYRAAELGSTALLDEVAEVETDEPDLEMRQELGRGQEAVVFSMGSSFAVREQTGIPGFYNALGELQRMDAINDVIEHGLPRWLKLPKHFALHADVPKQKTYGLMEKVNGGLTVEDVANYPDVPDNRAMMVERELGDGDILDAQARVPELYDRAYEVLSDALRASGRDPNNYLTDWKPRNAIVEGRLATPIAGSHYMLSVIDQYRA